MPATEILYKENPQELEKVGERLGFPLVLKIPDGSFSRGVIKVEDQEQLLAASAELFERSVLILAQEFFYTEYDWRIGVLNRKPIFACQYFMSKGHWQIYDHSPDAEEVSGDFRTMPVHEAPRKVVELAVKTANLIGDGLYRVDLKQAGDKVSGDRGERQPEHRLRGGRCLPRRRPLQAGPGGVRPAPGSQASRLRLIRRFRHWRYKQRFTFARQKIARFSFQSANMPFYDGSKNWRRKGAHMPDASNLRRLLVVDPCDDCRRLLPGLREAGWAVDSCALETARERACDVGLLRLRPFHLERPETVKDLISRSGTEWIAVLSPDTLPVNGVGDFVCEWFFDFHTLPFDMARVQVTLGRAFGIARLRGRGTVPGDAEGEHELLGESLAVRDLRRLLAKLAPTDSPVLIRGEAAPARNWSRVPCTGSRGARTGRSSRSTAGRFPST